MKKRSLVEKLRDKFCDGLAYVDAIELCIALYCSSDWFEDVYAEDFSKESIADVFSKLVEDGVINSCDEAVASARGAGGDFSKAEHWRRIIASSLLLNRFYDVGVVERLIR